MGGYVQCSARATCYGLEWICVYGAQMGSEMRHESMTWAPEFLVSACSPGKGELALVKGPPLPI